ncbi:MAG: hypothetical protein KDK01_07965 [Rhodobacteraceae bacterium]|jgi:hypothetical protein|nr:hypothetical protein [Paracoccaceae bacterium]
MIRALVLTLGLVLGLCAALAVGGRMAHLRMVTDGLPGWSEGIDDRAGVLAGQGRVAGAVLRWRQAGIGWQVTLSGADWQARGMARIMGWEIRIEGFDGVIPASLLVPGAAGMLALADGMLRIALPAGILTDAELHATARGLELTGAPPDGPLILRFSDGDWGVIP